MISIGETKQLVDDLHQLMSLREAQGWDAYWRDAMRFALPHDVSYDQLLYSGSIGAVTSALTTGPSSQRDEVKRTYDQTSLWAIERLTAGLISLKTPESVHWHGLDVDDPFGYEATLEEEAWFDKVTRYLFKVRANPKSGFWPSHKAATRSVTALGDGYFFLEEQFGSQRIPYRYSFVPLGECYVEVDIYGQISRFFRYRRLTAAQIVQRWPGTVSTKIKNLADNSEGRHTLVPIIHAVVPRDDITRSRGIGVGKAPWHGVYIDADDNLPLGETGYWEMPYIGHSWNSTGVRPYSEGPMALALAEVKSLNEMAKNELISAQQAVRPPLATLADNFTRVNLNAGAVNAGMLNGDGKLLVQPIMTHTRPDFAQEVLEARRNNVREMLYLNLWQILIERPDMTATEAMLRAQEKGDLLGPVGISFNHSLSAMLDREIGILGRKGAFEPGSPLEAPESVADKEVMPFFTAPLDRMRNMDEIIGAQRTVQGMLEVASFKPEILERLNVDRYAELMRKGNGAPADLFYGDEEMKAKGGQQDQAANLANMLQLVKAGGDAAGAMGNGVQALQGAAQGMGPAPAVANAVRAAA